MFTFRSYINLFKNIVNYFEPPPMTQSSMTQNENDHNLNERTEKIEEIEERFLRRMQEIHEVKDDKISERMREIDDVLDLVNLPDSLDGIINQYAATEMKQRIITFNQSHPHKFNIPDESPQCVPTFLLELKMCQKLICHIIRLENGLLVSGSFLGLVQIWDPLTGECLKKNNMLENHFISLKEHYPQILKMVQVSDRLIAITHFNVHYGAPNNVFVMDIIANTLQMLNESACTTDIFPLDADSFATATNDSLITWYITDHNTVEMISKKNIPITSFLFVTGMIILSSKNRLIILDAITKEQHVIRVIDQETKDEINYPLEHGTTICNPRYWVIDDYLFFQSMNIKSGKMKSLNVLNVSDNYAKTLVPCSESNQTILHIVHLKNKNLIALIDQYFIKILDPCNDFECITQISLGAEKIRTATYHENGLVTVNYLSEIKMYDFI